MDCDIGIGYTYFDLEDRDEEGTECALTCLSS